MVAYLNAACVAAVAASLVAVMGAALSGFAANAPRRSRERWAAWGWATIGFVASSGLLTVVFGVMWWSTR